MKFPIHTEASAPEASKAWLAKTRESFGMIPNLERVLATSPAALSSYSFMWEQFETTSFTPQEQQVIYLTANYENECNYCVPWHTFLAEQVGLAGKEINALRNGAALTDEKLNALYHFTRNLLVNRGKASEAQLNAFFDAGYTDKHALEVIMGLSIKLISNFTNSIAGTPLDKEVESKRWVKPLIEMRK